MGHRPNLMGEPGEEPPGLAGLLQEAAPLPRHRLLILPAAQQFRLGVAFSFLVSMVAAHTAPPSGAVCTAILGTILSSTGCRRAHSGDTQGLHLGIPGPPSTPWLRPMSVICHWPRAAQCPVCSGSGPALADVAISSTA